MNKSGATARPRSPFVLKKHWIRFPIPGEAVPIALAFMRRTGFYSSLHQMAESALAYCLWCERTHHLTGPSFASQAARHKMWQEVIADFGKDKKSGSYFQHCVEERARALLRERNEKKA